MVSYRFRAIERSVMETHPARPAGMLFANVGAAIVQRPALEHHLEIKTIIALYDHGTFPMAASHPQCQEDRCGIHPGGVVIDACRWTDFVDLAKHFTYCRRTANQVQGGLVAISDDAGR